jgi:DNA-binding MurR/RpiR family transcriptional regulator
MPVPDHLSSPIFDRIAALHSALTPKSRILAAFVAKNPRKAMFMTVAELAKSCQVSEATVVRFSSQLGYRGYADFLQALRDVVDTELTLPDRLDLADRNAPGADRFRRMVFEEIDNLRQLYEHTDLAAVDRVVTMMHHSPEIFVLGSRLSYTLAYYLGWSLTKIRAGIQIFKGSDKATIDWMTIAPADALIVIIAISRYPNDLIRLAKLAKRQGQRLVVITDSRACPLLQCADESLVSPSTHIPLFGSPTTLSCLANVLIYELAICYGDELKTHQEKLEQAYWENDVLFNMKRLPPDAY